MDKNLLVMEEYEVEGYTVAPPERCPSADKDCAQDCVFSTAVYTIQD